MNGVECTEAWLFRQGVGNTVDFTSNFPYVNVRNELNVQWIKLIRPLANVSWWSQEDGYMYNKGEVPWNVWYQMSGCIMNNTHTHTHRIKYGTIVSINLSLENMICFETIFSHKLWTFHIIPVHAICGALEYSKWESAESSNSPCFDTPVSRAMPCDCVMKIPFVHYTPRKRLKIEET